MPDRNDRIARSAPRSLALTLLAASAVRAQQVFPSGVELVAVDVTVVDGEGRPVPDLRPEDSAVKVGGRARKVVTAQLVLPDGTEAGRVVRPLELLPIP